MVQTDHVTVRMPRELNKEIEQAIDEMDSIDGEEATRSSLIRKAVNDYLSRGVWDNRQVGDA